MARAIISFVLGAVILGLSIWLMGVGGALMVSGWAILMDVVSPTSRKI